MSVVLRGDDGRTVDLPVDRWIADADAVEVRALRRMRGPVLDVGCGPGRLVMALNGLGVVALGIDPSPSAVAMAHERGATALARSVFDRVPGAGRWRSAILLDGNIGIGGDPVSLLRRVANLLARDGRLLVEVDDGSTVERFAARLHPVGPGGPTGWFPWAQVGVGALGRVARPAGLRVVESWQDEGRHFAVVTR